MGRSLLEGNHAIPSTGEELLNILDFPYSNL